MINGVGKELHDGKLQTMVATTVAEHKGIPSIHPSIIDVYLSEST